MIEDIHERHPGSEPLPSSERNNSQTDLTPRDVEAPSPAPPLEEPLPAVSPSQVAGMAQNHDLPGDLLDADFVRFTTPSDTYTPRPSSRSHGGGHLSTASSPASVRKPRMEFMYPPIPRMHKRPRDEVEEIPRAFSPGGCWLDKMNVDLQEGRSDVLKDLEQAKREVQEALVELARAKVALKREAKEMKEFIDWLRGTVGEEMVADIIEEVKRREEGGASDKEDADSGDSGGDDPGDDEHGQGGQEDYPKSFRRFSHGPSIRRGGFNISTRDSVPSHLDPHGIDSETGNKNENSNGQYPPRGLSTSVGLLPGKDTDEETVPPHNFGLTATMMFGNNALPTEEIHRRIGEYLNKETSKTETRALKRAKHTHSPTPPSPTQANSARNHCISSVVSLPPEGSNQFAASSSCEYGPGDADDDDEGGSELEVERSVRYHEDEDNNGLHDANRCTSAGGHKSSSVDGDSPSSPHKRDFRRGFSDFFASDAEGSSSSGSHDTSSDADEDERGRVRVTILEYQPNAQEDKEDDDFDELDLEDEEPDAYEFDVDDDELDCEEDHEVKVALYFTREGSRGGSWTSERWEPEPREPTPPYWGSHSPRYSSSPPPSSSVPLPFSEHHFEGAAEPAAGSSQAVAGPSNQPVAGPSNQPIAGPTSAPPIASPSDTIRRRGRPLTRDRERIRETATGGVEAYNYDEGSEYEERERRVEEDVRAWRTLRSGYAFNAEFHQMRAPPEETVSFEGEAESDEEAEDDV